LPYEIGETMLELSRIRSELGFDQILELSRIRSELGFEQGRIRSELGIDRIELGIDITLELPELVSNVPE
jgi:hypothetical protein